MHNISFLERLALRISVSFHNSKHAILCPRQLESLLGPALLQALLQQHVSLPEQQGTLLDLLQRISDLDVGRSFLHLVYGLVQREHAFDPITFVLLGSRAVEEVGAHLIHLGVKLIPLHLEQVQPVLDLLALVLHHLIDGSLSISLLLLLDGRAVDFHVRCLPALRRSFLSLLHPSSSKFDVQVLRNRVRVHSNTIPDARLVVEELVLHIHPTGGSERRVEVADLDLSLLPLGPQAPFQQTISIPLEPEVNPPLHRLLLLVGSFRILEVEPSLQRTASHEGAEWNSDFTHEVVERELIIVEHLYAQHGERGRVVLIHPVIAQVSSLEVQLELLIELGVEGLRNYPRFHLCVLPRKRRRSLRHNLPHCLKRNRRWNPLHSINSLRQVAFRLP
mmetsp:Transcript_29214/g.93871  ORF Transcript_29214/g.93871 Transcript_29214/m.93871 type:complete len:391 (-) Transcript_29214:1598-2770(-)